MVGTGHWASYTDWKEMRKEALERDPQVHRFGVLAGSSCTFDELHHWFDDEQDFHAFQARASELDDESIGDIAWTGTLDELAKGDSEEARERRRAFWELQAEQADSDDDDDDDSDDSLEDDDDDAEDDEAEDGEEICNEEADDLDEDTDEESDDTDDEGPVAEIPDELMDEFVASLYPDWWTGG